MTDAARVHSVAVLEDVRTALARFAHDCQNALTEAEGDAQREVMWLRGEGLRHWKREVLRRTELLTRAKSELMRAQISQIIERPDLVDYRRAVEKAKSRLEEAQSRLAAVRHWTIVLERELVLYKGATQRLSDAAARDVPNAREKLRAWAQALAEYAAVAAGAGAGPGTAGAPEHARPAGGGDGAAEGAVDAALASLVARCRRLRLAPALRALLEIDDAVVVIPPAWTGEPPDEARAAGGVLMKTGLSPRAPAAEDKVVMLGSCFDGSEVVFVRAGREEPGEPEAGEVSGGEVSAGEAGAGDSGWTLARVGEGVSGEATAVSVGRLCALRPGLAEILALPAGSIALFSGGRLARVIDASGRDRLWT